MPKARFESVKNEQLIMLRPIGPWNETIARKFVDHVNGLLASKDKEKITPPEVSLIQTDDINTTMSRCRDENYCLDKASLIQFLSL